MDSAKENPESWKYRTRSGTKEYEEMFGFASKSETEKTPMGAAALSLIDRKSPVPSVVQSNVSVSVQKTKIELEFADQISKLDERYEDLQYEKKILQMPIGEMETELELVKEKLDSLNPTEEKAVKEAQSKIRNWNIAIKRKRDEVALPILKIDREIKSIESKKYLISKNKDVAIAEIEEIEYNKQMLTFEAEKKSFIASWAEHSANQNIEENNDDNTEEPPKVKFEGKSDNDENVTKEEKTAVSVGPTVKPIENASVVDQLALMLSQAFEKVTVPQRTQVDNSKFLARQTTAKDLPHFHGRPEQWPAFISDFNRTTKICGFTDDENIGRLRKCLKDDAAKAVECMMTSPDNLEAVMKRLKTRFGQTEHIVEAMIKKASQITSVREDRLETIIEFGTAVANLTTTIESLDCKSHLANPQLLKELECRLPNTMRMQWLKWIKTNSSRKHDLVNFSEWISEETELACQLCPPKIKSDKQIKFENRRDWRKTENVHAVDEESQHKQPDKRTKVCQFCKAKNHWINECGKFKSQPTDDRRKFVRENRLCFSCLIFGHRSSECRKDLVCSVSGCKEKHHRLLHFDEARKKSAVESEKKVSVTKEETTPTADNSINVIEKIDIEKVLATDMGTIMGVLPVTIKANGQEEEVYAFVDNGSSISLIESDLAEKLGLQGELSPFCMTTMTSTEHQPNSRRVCFEILGIHAGASPHQFKDVRTVKSVPLRTTTQDMKKLCDRWSHLSEAPLPSFENVKPKILLGNSHIYYITPLKSIGQSEDEPMAFKSRIGWYIGGPQRKVKGKIDTEYFYSICEESDQELHQLVKKYFSTEDFGVKIKDEKPRSKEDQRALKILESTTVRTTDGERFETGLLWKHENVELPESYINAKNRLFCQERKMDKDSKFAEKYCAKMEEYLQKGFIRKLTSEERLSNQGKREWYLPHFGVVNPNKPEKLRLVFDAASKSNGVSLNSMLVQGPDLSNPIVAIMWRFRQFKFAFMGDIMDMFHRVFVRKEDLPSQRFLWRGMERNKPPDVYEMLVLIFGATCSPCSAQFVKNKNAAEHEEIYPEACHAIMNQVYVDDYPDSKSDEDTAIKLIKEIIEVQAKAGFKVCNWVSNSKKVVDSIPLELQAKEIKGLDFTYGEFPLGRVLGLWWDPGSDNFTYTLNYHKVPKVVLDGTKRPTKRDVLKLTMSVYDPLGFIGHLTVKVKILLQDIWRSEIGWDDEVGDQVLEKWRQWLQELHGISDVKIPRCYSVNVPTADNIQLHLFCDASEKAFATVSFLRVKSTAGVDINIVGGKSRVAPLKPMSIPRLELQAALMGARLGKSISSELEIKIDETHYWTDSRTVLCWLRNDARRFKQFVSHRIGEISELSDVTEWHWVPSKLNVADDATRDDKPSDISLTSRWFVGEQFLREEKSYWPVEDDIIPLEVVMQVEAELKTEVLVTASNSAEPDVMHFSKFLKLVRVTAWIYRFIRNLTKRKTLVKGAALPELTVIELRNSEESWCKVVQRECFGQELTDINGGKPITRKSKLLKLSPIKHAAGILRVGGRIDKAKGIPQETKHPIILDSKHPFTKLLISYYHVIAGHQGRNTVANELRQKYWILGLTAGVKRAATECQICKIRKAKPAPPVMGELPSVRLESRIRPFRNTGLDFFGPMMVTVGRRKEKRWGAIFTCLSTRAVHLEVAASLDTDSAIMTIRRMGNRRGHPLNIYCDNGTNFHGAKNELQKARADLDQNEIEQKLSAIGIQWHFIPPASPHMGGAWERLVGSVKRTLNGILQEREPKDEVLHTFFTEVENILNNRPLTDVSVDPKDPSSLTPNHFIFGWSNGMNGEITESMPNPTLGKFGDNDLWLRKQWRSSQRLADHFWTRWIKEYLPTLTRREKWCQQAEPIKVGDIVIVVDDQAARNTWQKGRVVAVYPGRDEKIRVVDVRTTTGTYRRPVSKICVLDVNGEDRASSFGGKNVRGICDKILANGEAQELDLERDYYSSEREIKREKQRLTVKNNFE